MSNLRRQCFKCPWKVGVNARDIPGDYSEDKHRNLASCIAKPADMNGLSGVLRIMACHETPGENELPCVGWLTHQIGTGNNLALRLRVAMGHIDAAVEAVGPQHQSFEATLPPPLNSTS